MLFSPIRLATLLAAFQTATAAPIAATTDSSNGLAAILAGLGGGGTAATAVAATAATANTDLADPAAADDLANTVATGAGAVATDTVATGSDPVAIDPSSQAGIADAAATGDSNALLQSTPSKATSTSTDSGLDSLLDLLGSGSSSSTTSVSSAKSSSTATTDGVSGIWTIIVALIKTFASKFDISSDVVDSAVEAVQEISSS